MRRLMFTGLLIAGLGHTDIGIAETPGSDTAGSHKVGMCEGCHGTAGYRNAYPAYRVPKLGGQHADYLIAALKAYKSGERGHKTMQAVAESLSDQDMAIIAAYYSQKKPGSAR